MRIRRCFGLQAFNSVCDVLTVMSVIVDLTVPADAFAVGEVLSMEGQTRMVLESVVPLGDLAIPFVRVFGGRDRFEESVRENPDVGEIRMVSEHDDEVLYAIEWDIGSEHFFEGIAEHRGTILEATGRRGTWSFELRFETHEGLSNFQSYCREAAIPIEVSALYNPTKPEAGPWYGLTPAQREALSRAVTAGYYSIPRETTTKGLADEFEISDQAMTERLRRAIVNLVTSTLLVSEAKASDDD